MSMQKETRCTKIADVDIDETINRFISEYSKYAQKEYKTRRDQVEKGVHWKMCKKFNFIFTNIWYMHNPEIKTLH